MQDYTKFYFIPWMVTLLLTISLVAMLWHGHGLLQKRQQTVDSLQTIHQQTVEDRNRYKRLANSNTEGLSNAEQREVLWATRAVLSETNNPREMLLIANVIRNRVDLGYRGRETAKEVILDPYQFSAFNPGRETRWRYANLEAQHVSKKRWQEAWTAARYAMTAPREVLPFDNPCVNHFVHPAGLVRSPAWMGEMKQVGLGDVQRPEIVFFRQNRTEVCQTDQSTSEAPTRLR